MADGAAEGGEGGGTGGKGSLAATHMKIRRLLQGITPTTPANASTPAAAAPGSGRGSTPGLPAGVSDASATCLPWDRASFNERVATFSIPQWFAKPREISPLQCARHGWINTAVDLLECVSCKAIISAASDEHTAKNVCETVRKALTDKHTTTCPWRGNPCPQEFAQQSGGMNTLEVRAAFSRRWSRLTALGNDGLPTISPRGTVSQEVLDAVDLTTDLQGAETLTASARQAACLLALCGWTKAPDMPDAIRCETCHRMMGLWMIKHIVDPFAATECTRATKEDAAMPPPSGAGVAEGMDDDSQDDPSSQVATEPSSSQPEPTPPATNGGATSAAAKPAPAPAPATSGFGAFRNLSAFTLPSFSKRQSSTASTMSAASTSSTPGLQRRLTPKEMAAASIDNSPRFGRPRETALKSTFGILSASPSPSPSRAGSGSAPATASASPRLSSPVKRPATAAVPESPVRPDGSALAHSTGASPLRPSKRRRVEKDAAPFNPIEAHRGFCHWNTTQSVLDLKASLTDGGSAASRSSLVAGVGSRDIVSQVRSILAS